MHGMSDTAILVEGLAKRFGDVEALKGIDFEVPTGSIFGLLGPNGAGKTTAVRVLATVISPDGGRAEVLGHDVGREAEAVRHRIRALIDGEPPGSTLSDERIVELLEHEGVDIARRTVAKYREAMRIPSSVRRRREKLLAV